MFHIIHINVNSLYGSARGANAQKLLYCTISDPAEFAANYPHGYVIRATFGLHVFRLNAPDTLSVCYTFVNG